MKKIKVGLNGFGRIGRAVTRIAFSNNSFTIAAINTRRTSPQMLAYLLQHDSVYRSFDKEVRALEDGISIEGQKIISTQISDPEQIPWGKLGVDIVIEATGAFTRYEDLQKHIKAGAKKVILSAPSKDEITPHVVLGVNDDKFDFQKNNIISNASCTTNNSAPIFYVLDKYLGVEVGFLTTIHAYTSTQSLLDKTNKKFTRSRAAAINLIPTTTGAAKAVVKVLPQLKGKLDGMAVRAPVPVGSFTDITAIVEKETTVEEVNQMFKEEAGERLKGILKYATQPLVSSDYIQDPHSSIFDSNYTKVMNGRLIKVFAWYDNEWGYSNRLVELVKKASEYL